MAKRRTNQNPGQTTISRFMLIVAFFAVWIGVIGVRLVYLQINQGQWLHEKALGQRRGESKIKTLRGSILDRSNRALAVSVKVRSMYADPRYIEDVSAISERLATALNSKQKEISDKILEAKQKKQNYVLLARKLDEETAKKVSQQLQDIEIKKIDGQRFKVLYWADEQKRSYPYNSLAAQVIGFSDLDDNGKAGIELSQDKSLCGVMIETWQHHDRLGRVYEESEDGGREPRTEVVLTLSNTIQFKVEEALKVGVEEAKAKSGVAIVLDPKTGEILAMANYPTFDLNKFSETLPELYSNKSIQNAYAPGSVFKLVTYGSALEEKVISPNELIDCNKGEIEVGGRVFADKHCVDKISYTDAFAISSNIGAIKTGAKLGREKFYSYVRRFGFGTVTGIELPGESRGIVRSPETWNGDSLASMSIGYEIGVTALQSASAFAAIANDGVRVRPHIIKEIRQAGGGVISTTEVEKTQIVSPETARSLRQMMQKVVLNGTGKRAQLNGYSSAGKTGTAWKYDAKLKKINENKYVSSFIGFASVDNPSVVIAVILDEPQVATRDGGHVAAPVFRKIAEQILPELNVVPDGTIRREIAVDIIEGKEVKPGENEKTANKRTNDLAVNENSKPPSDIRITKEKGLASENKPIARPKSVLPDAKPKSDSKNKLTEKGKI